MQYEEKELDWLRLRLGLGNEVGTGIGIEVDRVRQGSHE